MDEVTRSLPEMPPIKKGDESEDSGSKQEPCLLLHQNNTLKDTKLSFLVVCDACEQTLD